MNTMNIILYMYIFITPPCRTPSQKKGNTGFVSRKNQHFKPPFFARPSWPETEPSVCCQRCVYAPCLAVAPNLL